MINRVFLDMDGVFVDFVRGAKEIHNIKTSTEELYDGKHGGYDIVEILGMSAPAFWKPMDEEFWAKLEWMPDGEEIFKVVEDAFGRENIRICTTPCANYGCIDGKRRWVERHLPRHYKHHLIPYHEKELFAKPTTLLIDDSDSNLEKFAKEGGNIVPIPRIWNQWYHLRNMVIPHLKDFFRSHAA